MNAKLRVSVGDVGDAKRAWHVSKEASVLPHRGVAKLSEDSLYLLLHCPVESMCNASRCLAQNK